MSFSIINNLAKNRTLLTNKKWSKNLYLSLVNAVALFSIAKINRFRSPTSPRTNLPPKLEMDQEIVLQIQLKALKSLLGFDCVVISTTAKNSATADLYFKLVKTVTLLLSGRRTHLCCGLSAQVFWAKIPTIWAARITRATYNQVHARLSSLLQQTWPELAQQIEIIYQTMSASSTSQQSGRACHNLQSTQHPRVTTTLSTDRYQQLSCRRQLMWSRMIASCFRCRSFSENLEKSITHML